jgi:triosephosphate isomerase
MKKIIVANWKMNPLSLKEARVIFDKTLQLAKNSRNLELVICPPAPFLIIGEKLKSKNVFLGAQDVSQELVGPYTGEISPKMLSNLGVQCVILGHSERRALGESNVIINKKILTTLKTKLKIILCLGENSRDDNGFYLAFIKNQLVECLASVPKNQIKNIIIAYEPVWAIGEKAVHEASQEEFIEIQIFIKKIVADLYDLKTATSLKIIYGGSVYPSNTKNFIEAKVNGLLIGRNSLKLEKLMEIIKNIN